MGKSSKLKMQNMNAKNLSRITLFVSNLPYSATSTDLQTLFSDIAPVRSAFVVLDQESKVSKGVGYVAFSVKEDAQMAYDQIQKEGLKLVNRALRVQWADNKVRYSFVRYSKLPLLMGCVEKGWRGTEETFQGTSDA